MAVGVSVSVSKVAAYSRMTEVNSFYARVVADGGTISDFSALRLAVLDYKAVQSLEPSLYTFASGRKAGVQYSLVPADGSGDLSVTRSGDTAMELNANGFWQPVAANLPRYDYVSGRPMLNVEELRTNLLPRYKTFPHSDWTKSGARIEGDPNNLGNNIVTNGTFNAGVSDFSSIRCSLLWNALQYCTCTQNSGGSNTFAIGQSSTTTIGKFYRIRFRAKAPVITEKPSLSTSHFSNISYISQPNLSTDWQNYDFYATASTTAIIIYLVTNSVADGTIVDIDDIVVNEMFGYASPFVDSAGANLMDGYKLVATANNGYIRLATAVTVTAATTYTNSIWIKRVTGTGQAYIIDTNTTDRAITLTTQWQRFEYAAAAGSTSGQIGVKLAVAGDEVLIANAQLEAGATALSPIGGAEGSTQTRNADVIVKTGASALIGQTEGYAVFEIYLSAINTGAILSLSDGTINNRIQISFLSATSFGATIRVAGVNNNFFGTIPTVPLGLIKVGFIYKANDFAVAVNGNLATSTDARNIPSGLAVINLGSSPDLSSFFNNRIKLTHLGKTRISNEKLIELTTL